MTAQVAQAIAEPTERAYTESFRVAFLAITVFGLCFLVASFLTPDMDEYLTGQVACRLIRDGKIPGKEGPGGETIGR